MVVLHDQADSSLKYPVYMYDLDLENQTISGKLDLLGFLSTISN